MTHEELLQEKLDELQKSYDLVVDHFDKMSEGYQESLLLYDKLEEKCNELKETNVQLDIARQRAEDASRMKTIFIQQISHEIRTPLNILSGFTQVVTTPGMELDDDTKADINRQITENTDRITRLVNKMLELSDVSSMAVIERDEQVPAVQIVAEATEASGIATAEHLTFDIQLSAEAETVILTTNQRAAVRALTLILDNARKFTKPAETLARQEEQPDKKRATLQADVTDGFVRFVVEDTGIGVPQEESERIFEEFVQLDEYYDGTGIGLTVARSLARRMGGDVVLDQSYTEGARFIMTLPI
jgi:signal transduction histidine kinase